MNTTIGGWFTLWNHARAQLPRLLEDCGMSVASTQLIGIPVRLIAGARLRGEQNASVINAKNELGRLERNRANLIQAIRDGIPASEVKADLACIATRRAELEAIVGGTKDERVLLHPNMSLHYRQQVAKLAAILCSDENRAEAADLLRS
jgi:hypothetical protein